MSRVLLMFLLLSLVSSSAFAVRWSDGDWRIEDDWSITCRGKVIPPGYAGFLFATNIDMHPFARQIVRVEKIKFDLQHPKPVVTVQAPVDQSVQAGQNMTGYYTAFNSLSTGSITDQQVDDFVTNVGRVLIRYPQHKPTAKAYFTNESRLVYKILFANIIYIVDSSDQDVLTFLRSNNTTQQEFATMDQIRGSIQSSGLMAFACVMSVSGRGSGNPMSVVVNRFIQGR